MSNHSMNTKSALLNLMRPTIVELKSTMDQYDNDGNIKALQALIAQSNEFSLTLPFQVLDHDMPIDSCIRSERCFWILALDKDINEDEGEQVVISPETDPLLFDQLLSYALNELMTSHLAQGGMRAGYYVNIAYAMLQLFDGNADYTNKIG